MPCLESLVCHELGTLYRVAQRMVGARDAEDLVGQTLMLAARSFSAFDGRHPRAWLLTILLNEARKSSRRPQSAPLAEDYPDHTNIVTETFHRITHSMILSALDDLPMEYRLAIVLVDIEELSYAEAAETLGLRSGTLAARLHRGRAQLASRLRSSAPAGVVE